MWQLMPFMMPFGPEVPFMYLLMTRVMQDQELHPETAADAQADEAYTLPREVAGHCSYSLPPDLYQHERRVLL